MESVALSSKGQFVLPKAIRDRHHWQAGTRLMVIDRGDEVVIKSAEPFAAAAFEAADAPAVYQGRCLSLVEMDHAITADALHLASSVVCSGCATMDNRLAAKGTSREVPRNILLIS